jgi:hypothetical protein
MSACPSIDTLQRADADIAAHLAICPACQSVVALLNPADDPADCARAELLIAAGAARPLQGQDANFLPSHLSRCPACRQIALEPVVEAPAIALPRVARDAYILGAEIGRGGMGRILSAHDRRIGRTVAIKEMLSSDPLALARFEREARITARLQHPGIVAIYEVARWPDDRPFYAMPILPGRTLREAIAGAASLDARLDLVPAVMAAAEAVAYAHSRRIIHRDLTPSNILLGSFGETIVIDWGVAKALDEEAEPTASPTESPPAGPLTVAGTVVGTVAYIPPEQADGDAVDERADVYALGAILHHVLTGRHPYQGHDADLIVTQLRARVSPPFDAEGAVPGALVAVVRRAMAADPDRRYRTAQELATDLRAYLSGGRKLLDYVAFGLKTMGRRRLPAAATFLLVLALVSLGIHALPRSYHHEVVLVEEDRLHPHQPPEPPSGPEPNRSLPEYALESLRRLNVRGLAGEDELLASWRASRAPLGRLADWIETSLGRTGPGDQAFEAALEKRPLSGRVIKEGSRTSITLAVDWPDRRMGYRLLAAAKESFVEIHQSEAMTRAGQPMDLLMVQARSARAELDRAFAVIEQLQLRRDGRARQAGPPAPAAPPRGGATLVCIDQMTLSDLDERHRRGLAGLERRLAAARASGDTKMIAEASEMLAGLKPESMERRRLREMISENQKLMVQQGEKALPLTGKEAEKDDTTVYWCHEDLGYDEVRFRAAATAWDRDDREMAVARAHLRTLLDSLDQLQAKIGELQSDLVSLRGVFRSGGGRHRVPHPPSLPAWPSRPSLTTRLAVSLPLALLLSLLAAVGADVRSRRRR